MAQATTPDVVVCGRAFSSNDLETIRGIIASEPPPNRRQIAAQSCQVLGWFRPDGRPKEMSCRVALIRLDRLGVIRLPPPLTSNGNGKLHHFGETLVAPDQPISCGVGRFERIETLPVQSAKASRLWNEVIQRFHYLGYKPLPGAQVRYLIESDRGLLGVIGFGASAWKVAPRDQWIGWSSSQRKSRLHLIVNNARFVLLPWVRCRNLASWVLSRCARRIPQDYETRYGYRPVLLETFVERDRFAGTCYQAANWRYVGETQGRGKLDRYKRRGLPIKKTYVYPLTANFRRVLCTPESP